MGSLASFQSSLPPYSLPLPNKKVRFFSPRSRDRGSYKFREGLMQTLQDFAAEWSLRCLRKDALLPQRFHSSHKVIRNSVWKEPQEVSSPTSCPEQGHFLVQVRLLGALSSRGLKAFNDGDSTASLCPGSTAVLSSQGKHFSLYPAWAFFVSACAQCLSSSTMQSSEELGSVPLITSSQAALQSLRKEKVGKPNE